MLISQPTLQHVLGEHARAIERLGWKGMDSDEFALAFLPLLKQLGRYTIKLNKTDVRKALAGAHLAVTVAEMDLYANKLCGTLSYIKRRLRDKGSGTRLPDHCKTLLKVTYFGT